MFKGIIEIKKQSKIFLKWTIFFIYNIDTH